MKELTMNKRRFSGKLEEEDVCGSKNKAGFCQEPLLQTHTPHYAESRKQANKQVVWLVKASEVIAGTVASGEAAPLTVIRCRWRRVRNIPPHQFGSPVTGPALRGLKLFPHPTPVTLGTGFRRRTILISAR